MELSELANTAGIILNVEKVYTDPIWPAQTTFYENCTGICWLHWRLPPISVYHKAEVPNCIWTYPYTVLYRYHTLPMITLGRLLGKPTPWADDINQCGTILDTAQIAKMDGNRPLVPMVPYHMAYVLLWMSNVDMVVVNLQRSKMAWTLDLILPVHIVPNGRLTALSVVDLFSG